MAGKMTKILICDRCASDDAVETVFLTGSGLLYADELNVTRDGTYFTYARNNFSVDLCLKCRENKFFLFDKKEVLKAIES